MRAVMTVNTAPLSKDEITQWFDPRVPVAGNTYEIALVLGGTVSAGAYTAGVLDFLIEALDSWTTARDAGQPVPRHNVMLRFIAGTSGGGVNAAIAARAFAYDFTPVSRGTPLADAALNPFYDTWINELTLADMLNTDDLDASGSTAPSLLNGRIIDRAADKLTSFQAGQPKAKPRPYLAAPLRLILTLTNLNGVAYRITFGSVTLANGQQVDLHQSYVDHADYARFAVVYPGQELPGPRPDEMVLNFDTQRFAQAMDWSTFGQFAMATAAFPVGFPPRRLTRPLTHYRYRVVSLPGGASAGGPAWLPLVPDWEAIQDWAGGGLPDDYQFLAVDGGATDNEPIELARTALAGLSSPNPRGGLDANRGVILIDPFAGAAAMAPPLTVALPDLARSFLGAILQQTRYDTRDLLLAADPSVYSRFMITALRGTNVGDTALATAGLGAFIGFACPAFRRHDYLIGRKNCQDFLRSQFVLPIGNQVFQGLLDFPQIDDFAITEGGDKYLPIIPLVGSASVPETTDPWPQNALDPSIYRTDIENRVARLFEKEFAAGPLSNVLVWLAAKVGQGKVADAAVTAMTAALKQWNLA